MIARSPRSATARVLPSVPGAQLARAIQFCHREAVSATGWRRRVLAWSAGGTLTLALPPIYVLPALVLGFSTLLWLLESSRRVREAAGVGWWFGFGHFLTGLYWIAYSFFVDAERLGWLGVPAVIGLSAFLALFPAGAAALARTICASGPGAVLALASTWTAAEWLRGHVLTGFPWNLIGYALTLGDAPLQAAAFFGIYGLSFATVLIGSLPALCAGADRIQWWPVALSLALGVALWAGGAVRLGLAPELTSVLSVRVVQGNIPQRLKWHPSEREAILERYIALSRGEQTRPDVVIWPETALPFAITTASSLDLLDTAAQGTPLLTGAIRVGPTGANQAWNSLVAIDPTGAVMGAYDKAHLVPFGEYVPLRWLLPSLPLVTGRGDFSPGPGPRTLRVPGIPPFSAAICYEAIFPGAVGDRKDRPQWIVNVTNDAWFGTSSGPYQHFAMSRVRAIEEGLPLVRAANTGVSAGIDPYGRVIGQLDLNESGFLDISLPRALSPPIYARIGDWLVLLLILFELAGACAWRWLTTPPAH
jgi:apolipoprotein N-acyltransferase